MSAARTRAGRPGARRRGLLAASLLATTAASQERTLHRLEVPGPVITLETCDLEGDGRAELLVARPAGLEVLALEEAGAGAPASLLRIPCEEAGTLAFTVDQGLLFLIRDGGKVQRWDASAGQAVDLLQDPELHLPAGVFSFPFARDVDGDGSTDLQLPRREGLAILFGTGDGFRPGLRVGHRVGVALGIPALDDLEAWTSRRITVPEFDTRDQNGDGRPDLSFREGDVIRFHWSDSSGRIPEKPTFILDLEKERRRLPRTGDLINSANLLQALEGMVEYMVRDLDGDGVADLLLRQGSLVSVWQGTSGGIDRSRARSVLKSSGNLVAAFTHDDSRDGRDDLCLLQVEDISLGKLLLWVVAGGSLDVDLFVYDQGESLRFSRRPSRRRRVSFSFPSLLSLTDDVEQVVERWADDLDERPVVADFDGDGQRDDAVRRGESGQLEWYRDAVPGGEEPGLADLAWDEVLAQYDRRVGDRDSLDLPLLELADWFPVWPTLVELTGRRPDRVDRVEWTGGASDPAPDGAEAGGVVLYALDLNGDAIDDVVIVEPAPDGAGYRLTILVSQ